MSELPDRANAATSAWLRSVADNAHDLVYVYQLDPPQYLYVSPACQDITGYSAGEFYADPAIGVKITHPDDVHRLQEVMARPDEHTSLKVRCIHKSGRIVWLEQATNPIRDDSGRVVALHGAARDVTEQRRAEEQLRASEEKYRALFESARDAIFLLEEDRFVDCNPPVETVFGWKPDELRGLSPRELSPLFQPDGEPSAEKAARIMAAAYAGEAQHFEWRSVRRDGREIDIDATIRRIEIGGRPMLLAMIRDLSERQQAERERAELQRALLQAQKMESVGRLAGSVAHDFNNLLTVIAGYAMLLEEDSQGTVRERLGEIVRATERAKELTQKLLIFSRRLPYAPRVFPIDEFLRRETSMLPRLVGEHIAVETDLRAPLCSVRVDPGQLTQILMNLVVNARDAMPEGGRLTIATREQQIDHARASRQPGVREGSYVQISVRDTGIGMAPEVQAHLFEPFYTTKQLGQGTGLGLATVYGLVQQAGGFIEVESAVQEGTAMDVFLPVTRVSPAETSGTRQPPVRGGDERILVVEDEESVRELTCAILARLGYRVLHADSPHEAIRLVRDGVRVDLIVTDVVMPGMNGRRLIAELEAIAGSLAVLYVSGFADAGVVGVDDVHGDSEHFLAKPFEPASLARKVRDLLDRRDR